MKTSQAGIDLIKQFEGCRLKAYKLAGEQYYTIGYGHSFDPSINVMTVWTQAQAEAALRIDLGKYEKYVEKYAKIKLSQPMFDALVSYTYNRGAGGMKKLAEASKTPEDYVENIVKLWGSAQRYKEALIKRRRKEQALFISGMKDPKIITTAEVKGENIKSWYEGRYTTAQVKELQAMLNQNGYFLKVDGIPGNLTIGAVLDYQKKNGLEPDGKAGPKTKECLMKSHTSKKGIM